MQQSSCRFNFNQLSLSIKNQYLSYNILSQFKKTNYFINIIDENIINFIDIYPSSQINNNSDIDHIKMIGSE